MLDKGIGGKIWRVVKNLYREVGSCVRLGKENTDWFSLEVGLRQGCILSPILFSIFIDELAKEVKKVGGARYGEVAFLCCQNATDAVYRYSKHIDFVLIRTRVT